METENPLQVILQKLTKWLVEFMFIASQHFKLVPFSVNKGPDSYRVYKLHRKSYQWFLYYFMEVIFVLFGIFHWVSFLHYYVGHGLNAYSVIYGFYNMLVTIGAVYTLCNLLHGREVVFLLNSTKLFRDSNAFGVAWDKDLLFDFLALQMLPGLHVFPFAYAVLQWVLPDAPWILLPKLTLGHAVRLPRYVLYPIQFMLEALAFYVPTLIVVQNAIIFMIGYTTIKLGLRALRCNTNLDELRLQKLCVELQIFSRICNNWWREGYLPFLTLGCFLFTLVSLFFTLTLEAPWYIYMIFPLAATICLCMTIVIFLELAHINIASAALISHAYTLNVNCVPSTGLSLSRLFAGAACLNSKRYIDPMRGPREKKYYGIFVENVGGRHRLYRLRPLRAEVGNFGCHVTVWAGFEIINAVITYLIVLLELHKERTV